jgi:energy-coupling factor transporter transmembrane protein EcfT
MNLKSSIIAFILTIVAVSILLYSIKDQPYLDLSDDYHYYSNIYRSKPYGIDMIRVVNEEDGVKYFISSKKEYFVRINGVDYQGVQEVEVGSNYEKQFVKAEIFDESQELQDTFSFYYSSNRSSLDFLEWYEYGFDKAILIIWAVVVFVFLVNLLFQYIAHKQKPKEVEVKSNNLWHQFKAMKTSDKIMTIICLIIYIFLPYPIIVIALIIMLVYITLKVKGFTGKIKAFGVLILSTMVGILAFIILYLNLVPEALDDYGYETPSVTLSEVAQVQYQDIIDHIEMYTKEPIAYFENDSLGFIALRGFIVWDHHEDGDITEIVLAYRLYNIDSELKKKLVVNIRINGEIIKQFTEHNENSEFIIDHKLEGVATLDLVNTSTGDVIYQSEAIELISDISDVNESIYYGGQYMANEHAYLFMTISAHIGAILTGFIIYHFRKNFNFNRVKATT